MDDVTRCVDNADGGRRQEIVYVMQAIETIGQLAGEIFWLRNLYERPGYEITVVTAPPASRPGTNTAVYEVMLRGLRVVWHDRLRWIDYGGPYGHAVRRVRRADRDVTYLLVNGMKLKVEFAKHAARAGVRYVRLSAEDLARAEGLRRRMGIGGRPLVTLHVREPSTKPQLAYHRYRDADIRRYVPTIEYLLRRGYAVVRLGDRSMQRLPIERPGLVDAPFDTAYEPWVEPCLIGTSRFYVGVPSGPYSVANALGVPVVLTNATVTSDDWGKPGDLFLPKIHYSRRLGRPLRYREVVCSEVVEFYRAEDFERAGLELQENDADDILSAVMEMERRLAGALDPGAAAFGEAVHRRFKAIQRQAHVRLAGLGRDPGCFLMYLSGARLAMGFARRRPWYVEMDRSGRLEVAGRGAKGLCEAGGASV